MAKGRYRMTIRFGDDEKSFLRSLQRRARERGITVSINDLVCGIVRKARHDALANSPGFDLGALFEKKVVGE